MCRRVPPPPPRPLPPTWPTLVGWEGRLQPAAARACLLPLACDPSQWQLLTGACYGVPHFAAKAWGGVGGGAPAAEGVRIKPGQQSFGYEELKGGCAWLAALPAPPLGCSRARRVHPAPIPRCTAVTAAACVLWVQACGATAASTPPPRRPTCQMLSSKRWVLGAGMPGRESGCRAHCWHAGDYGEHKKLLCFHQLCIFRSHCREPTPLATPCLPPPGVWQGSCCLQGSARLAPAAGQEAGRAVVGIGACRLSRAPAVERSSVFPVLVLFLRAELGKIAHQFVQITMCQSTRAHTGSPKISHSGHEGRAV